MCNGTKKTANRPSEWREIKNNVPKQFKREEWGGSSEINIWAIITKTITAAITAAYANSTLLSNSSSSFGR
jgi:hypothetical protein